MTPPPDDAPTFQQFASLLEDSPAKAAALLERVHAADATEWLQDISDEEAWRVFSSLPTDKQAELFEYAEENLREELVHRLSTHRLRAVVERLPPDEAVDLLADADDRVAKDVLDSVPEQLAAELRQLIAHPAESAGGVMTTEYVTVSLGTRVGDAVKQIKKEGADLEDEVGVFVVDAEERPVGYLSDRILLTRSIHELVDDVMVAPFSVAADEDQEEAANLFSKYGLQVLAVVDQGGALVGVITAEDAQEILESEVREDILRLVGAAPAEQQTRLPVLRRVRQRMPLMAVTVLGGLASARILELFLGADAGETSTILRYLPLIIGLAGNVGIQSSTILVRAFATGEVEPKREAAVLGAEVLVGCLIGLLCGGATVLVASWIEDAVAFSALGGAVGAAIATAVTWAALLGCVVPIGCRRLGIDPAIVAGPFLICLSDVSGSAIYIAVARLLVSMEAVA